MQPPTFRTQQLGVDGTSVQTSNCQLEVIDYSNFSRHLAQPSKTPTECITASK